MQPFVLTHSIIISKSGEAFNRIMKFILGISTYSKEVLFLEITL